MTVRDPSPSSDRQGQRCDVVLVGIEIEENLSLRYLAAACENADLRAVLSPVANCDALEAAVERVLALKPRVVGLSMTFQCFARAFLQFAKLLRNAGFDGHITAGGHFATLAAEHLLRDAPQLDSIVMHEGETTLVEMVGMARSQGSLDAATLKDIEGVSFRLPGGEFVTTALRALGVLDSLSPPIRMDPPPQRFGIAHATLVGSRGCYGSCTYCSIHAWYRTAAGPRFRQRSVTDIVEEMFSLHRRGVRIFNFHDDNFFLPSPKKNIERLDGIIDAIAAKGMKDVAIVIKCRPNDVNAEVLDRLEALRVIRAYVGFETASMEGIKALGRGVDREEIRSSVRLMRERSIFHTFNMLLFDPDTTLESLVTNLDVLEEYAEVPFDFCRTEVYVRTPLEMRLQQEGRLRGTYMARSYGMLDSRAELMFRISATAFHRRNFAVDGVALLNLNMRFDLEILRRFFPRAWDASFHAKAVELSGDVGRSTVGHLRSTHAFVSNVDLQDHAAIRAFTVDLSRAIHRDDFLLFSRIREMNEGIVSRTGCASRT